MARWTTFFVFVFVVGQILALALEGGGFASTRLNGEITSTATTITVDDTANFLSADVTHPAYVVVGNSEVASYTDKTSTQFTGCERGVADPQSGRQVDAEAHADNTTVKTLSVAAMDSYMGYNITTSGAAFGALDAAKFVLRFFVNLPKFLLWDYPWFTGPLVIVRFVLFAFSAGFIFGLGLAMLNLARGIWGT